MKRYKAFILNEKLRSDTTELSYDEIRDIIKKNCKEFSLDDIPIYRGLGGVYLDYILLDPKNFDRKSLTDINTYNAIADHTWRDYPKRKNSLICTTSKSYTGVFGNLYRVIPFDGSKWGVAPKHDFWYSFNDLIKQFDPGSTIQQFFRYISLMYDEFFGELLGELTDFNEIKKAFNKIQKHCKDNSIKLQYEYGEKYGFLSQKLLSAFLHDDNFFDWIVEQMKPEKNGFKLLDYKDLANKELNGNRELWTDSKCLMIYCPDGENNRLLDSVFNPKWRVHIHTKDPEWQEFISDKSPVEIKAFDEDEIYKMWKSGENKTGAYISKIERID